MSSINKPIKPARAPMPLTANGAPAFNAGPEQTLYRLVSTAMLWEDTYYVNGKTVAQHIAELVPKCRPEFVAATAVHARHSLHLRHAPLLAVREMVRHPEHRALVGRLLPDVIARPDEISEFLSIYWAGDKSQPIAKQVKIGLGEAFNRFNDYQLAKWDKKNAAIRLRDAMFLVHAKPKHNSPGIRNAAWRKEHVDQKKLVGVEMTEQERLYNQTAQDELPQPETWERMLSSGADPKATFEGLMLTNQLGVLAFIRNLRKMTEAGVEYDIIKAYSEKVKTDRVLPYQFIAAARVMPQYEAMLEAMMLRSVGELPKLSGRTALLVDVSGSMDDAISEPPKAAQRRAAMRRQGKEVMDPMKRFDAACGLAILCRELCEDLSVWTFSANTAAVAPRRGFALRDAIMNSQPFSSTYLGRAVREVNGLPFDRLIVLTDEQSNDPVPAPMIPKAYMINVAPNKFGVGFNQWVSISGFSEAVFDWIRVFEEGV